MSSDEELVRLNINKPYVAVRRFGGRVVYRVESEVAPPGMKGMGAWADTEEGAWANAAERIRRREKYKGVRPSTPSY